MSKITAETITMQQILQHYWDSKDPAVVRACITFLHGIPMIASFAGVGEHGKAAALDAVVSDFNARHGAES